MKQKINTFLTNILLQCSAYLLTFTIWPYNELYAEGKSQFLMKQASIVKTWIAK
jgi:hypothetical protein